VTLNLLFGPPITHVIRDVAPIPQAIDLTSLNQQQLFVSPPIFSKDGNRVWFDYSIVVPGFVLTNLFTFAEALATKIEVIANEGSLGK